MPLYEAGKDARWVMDDKGIIIADKDAEYRNNVADYFRDAGYQVETTDSAVHVLCSILEKQTPVLLLGSDFDRKVCSADLIHLLKKCNRNLSVILVSDDMPLELARKIRQEGVFYHALKPVEAGDTEELGQAVACAFKKSEALASTEPDPIEPEPAVCACEEEAEVVDFGQLRRAIPWVLGLAALIFGTSYLGLLAAESAKAGSYVAIWVFLGFCSLIVIGQIVPIFRIKLRKPFGVPENRRAHQEIPRD